VAGEKVCLVINPMSGAGRTAARVELLQDLARTVFGEVAVRLTSAQGEGTAHARAAAQAGADLVIAVGGDGTANEVVNGVMLAGRPEVAFGLLPAGTGSDLAKTLAMPADWGEALGAIAAAPPAPTDVMIGTFTTDRGPLVRYGINVIGMGLAGRVVRYANESGKQLGGRATFLISTLRAFATHRPTSAALSWETPEGDTGSWRGELLNVFIGNGRYCGGGMMTGPHARMDDGLLDIVIVEPTSVVRSLAGIRNLYDGTIGDLPHTATFRARAITAEPIDGSVLLSDVDGEQPGRLPAEVRCLHGALQVRAPWMDGARAG
jgi:diacylglycerol kinase (ATP)